MYYIVKRVKQLGTTEECFKVKNYQVLKQFNDIKERLKKKKKTKISLQYFAKEMSVNCHLYECNLQKIVPSLFQIR